MSHPKPVDPISPTASITRRRLLAAAAGTAAGGAVIAGQHASGQPRTTTPATTRAATTPTFPGDANVGWLERPGPSWFGGTTFGVAWPRGEHRAEATFRMQTADGTPIAAHSWPTAYWPDGSLKWTAHAVSGAEAKAIESSTFTVAPGEATGPAQALKVEQGEGQATVDTGVIRATFEAGGRDVVGTLQRGDRVTARAGRLVGFVQTTPTDRDDGYSIAPMESRVDAVAVEQGGPVRAVVRVTGTHRAGDRGWLPFTLRFYFYAGSDAVRVMHTFVFDGDEHNDFIRGLGVRFDVPMTDALHDRHVRFTGEGRGVFGEAVRGITGLRRDPGEAVRDAQIAGEATPPVEQWDPRVGDWLHLIPAWGDYTLAQLSADGYQVRKRTKPGHGWIDATAGRRASGGGYVGGPGGGLAFGLRNFWQSHPAQLDIRDAHADAAQVTLWLWSPDAPAMDLRFYHDGLGMDTFEEQLDGLNVTYEDYEPGFGTPHGIARTSEVLLRVCDRTPGREAMADFGESVATPPQLACSPGQLIEANVFGGLFAAPDRSTPRKRALEDQLDSLFDYYVAQRENQRWYGFWNYGDVMHSYDRDRHTWRYDVGGYAWDNSELSPDLWLWYAYCRSGDAGVFRFAEAMTRHTGEVDVYHLGRFKHLGTRHNVQHWGCSAKQMRISTAIYRRFYYFLTADERVGDLLAELTDVVSAAVSLDPVRKVRDDVFDPRPEALSLGTGTDFSAVAAAWLTQWERTGDAVWRDRLTAALESIGELPNGFFTPVTFDMNTGRFSAYGEPGAIGVSHLSAVFGLVEVNAELIGLLDVPKFRDAWLQYCRLYNAPREEQAEELGRDLGRLNLRDHHSRLTAYAADQLGDDELARRAWREFGVEGERVSRYEQERREIDGPDVMKPIIEDPWVSTNWTSQYCLSAIQCLALAPEALEQVQ